MVEKKDPKKVAAGRKGGKAPHSGGRKSKATEQKKTASSENVQEGSKYSCSTCGLAVTVDEECGCVDYCDLICCGSQMLRC